MEARTKAKSALKFVLFRLQTKNQTENTSNVNPTAAS